MVYFWKNNHHARTYVRLLGPCSRRVDWGPLLPWASWTCHLLLSRERPCIRAWRVSLLFVLHSQTHNNHLRTDSKHEGVTPLAWKFDPPNEWYPFLHIHHQSKHDNCCPRRSPKCLIRESLAATRLIYFLSLSDSKNACTGVIPLSWNNETTSNDLWVLSCLQDLWNLNKKNWCWLTKRNKSAPICQEFDHQIIKATLQWNDTTGF